MAAAGKRRRGALLAASLLASSGAMGGCASQDEGGPPGTVVTLASGQSTPTAIVVSGSNVYWINAGTDSIVTVPVSGGQPTTIAHNQFNPSELAVDGTNLYWTNYGGGDCTGSLGDANCVGSAVMKMPLAGGAPTTLAAALGPTSIAVDGTNVYWLNSFQSEVTVPAVVGASIAGGPPFTLAPNQGKVVSVAVGGGDVFWDVASAYYEYDEPSGMIFRAPVRGGEIGELPDLQYDPSSITTDIAGLYWLDREGPDSDDQTSVFTVGYGGGPASRLAVSAGGVSGVGRAIAVDETNVYWTAYDDQEYVGYVMAVPKRGGALTTLAIGDTEGGGIAVDSTSVYWTSSNAVLKISPKNATGTDVLVDGGIGSYGSSDDSSACSEGALYCGDSCVDPTSDTANCGGCGVTCPGEQSCTSGVCGCGYEYVDCDGVCAYVDGDDTNCGACGNVCPSAESCYYGSCACAGNETYCAGVCVEEGSDDNNCGGCGKKCPSGTTCESGSCTCPNGDGVCNNTCVDEQTDVNNCGKCGNVCPTGEVCAAGNCGCANGGILCGATCVLSMTDPTNCGACSMVCPVETPYCGLGNCVVTPAPNCAPGGAGLSSCGASQDSCCTSLPVPAATYDRTYDPLLNDGGPITGSDGSAAGLADPVTVSGVSLDKYLVTVGRFRQFAYAWDNGVGYFPPAGSGVHAYLNGGSGLAAASATSDGGVGPDGGSVSPFEPGWVVTDDANVAPTSANLICDAAYASWTATPGANENLPINCVTWAEAYAFCIWDGGFLPSEAEWQNAAAAGAEEREFPWGSYPGGSNPSYVIDECDFLGPIPDGGVLPEGGVMPGICSGTWNIAPVGTATLGAAATGQLDMVGEGWEFVLDGYGAYVSPCTDCANVADTTLRCVRGVPFSTPPSPYDIVTSARGSQVPTTRTPFTGFRCARAPAP